MQQKSPENKFSQNDITTNNISTHNVPTFDKQEISQPPERTFKEIWKHFENGHLKFWWENISQEELNNIMKIIAENNKLGEIKQLTIVRNKQDITQLPPEIWELANLETLSISDTPLTQISPNIWNLTKLKKLDLRDCEFNTLPKEIWNLKNLTILSLQSCEQLTTLPSEVYGLINLEELLLFDANIATFSPEIWKLVNLKVLSTGKIKYLPPEIWKLIKLERLRIMSEQLTFLPPEIWNLTNLKELWTRKTWLTELPPEIGKLTSLKELTLVYNKLTTLPPEIWNLTNIERLEIFNNKFTTIPGELSKLTKLSRVALHSNSLKSLPTEIRNSTHITELILSNNKFETLPPDIWNLVNLDTLYLPNNLLKEVPPEIWNLTRLNTLDLSNNNLTEIPLKISELPSLKNLKLDNNNITPPRERIYNNSLKPCKITVTNKETWKIEEINKKTDTELLEQLDHMTPEQQKRCIILAYTTYKFSNKTHRKKIANKYRNISNIENITDISKIDTEQLFDDYLIITKAYNNNNNNIPNQITKKIALLNYKYNVNERYPNIKEIWLYGEITGQSRDDQRKLYKEALLSNIQKQASIYPLITNWTSRFFFIWKDKTLLTYYTDPQLSTEKILIEGSSEISETISNLYRYYDQPEAHNLWLHEQYSPKTKELLKLASTEELISSLWNHVQNLSYTFDYTLNEIRWIASSKKEEWKEIWRKKWRLNWENIFSYIDNLDDNYSTNTKSFLKWQIIIWLLVRWEKDENWNTVSREKSILYNSILNYNNKTDISNILSDILLNDITESNISPRATWIIWWLNKILSIDLLKDQIITKLKHWKKTQKKIILAYLKLSWKQELYEDILKKITRNKISKNKMTKLVEKLEAKLWKINIDFTKQYNDIVTVYVWGGGGGWMERIIRWNKIFRHQKEQELLKDIESWKYNIQGFEKTSAENILELEKQALQQISITWEATLINKKTQEEKQFDLSNCEEFNEKWNTYRKSEVLRYAEEKWFSKISGLSCLSDEQKNMLENWWTKKLLEKQDIINNLLLSNNFIILENTSWVRMTYILYNKITGTQKSHIQRHIQADFVSYRWHNVTTRNVIPKWKNMRNTNACILDWGCTNASHVTSYKLDNPILAYKWTGRALTSLYVTDKFIEFTVKKRQRTLDIINTREQFAKYSFSWTDRQSKYLREYLEIPWTDINNIINAWE